MKKKYKIFLSTFVTVIILLLVLFSKAIMYYAYYGSNDYVTIGGKEYFYEGNTLRFYTENTFKTITPGMTYGEVVSQIGPENGQFSKNGLKGNIFYILTEKNKFMVLSLVPNVENKDGSEELVVLSMCIYNEKKVEKIIFNDQSLYDSVMEKWNAQA